MSASDTRTSRLRIDRHLTASGRPETLAEDVRRGLTSSPKYLLPKYFYDDAGSGLFERITETPEYYPTRAEAALLSSVADGLMRTLRPRDLVELGSGSSTKTRRLLDAPTAPSHVRRYIPLDVSEDAVQDAAGCLLKRYPFLTIHAVIADFDRHLSLVPRPDGRRLVLFLGSTIGNLEPAERRRFLSSLRDLLGPEGRLLVGLDLVKERDALHAAYNDAQGLTAAFNRNILAVVNAGLNADFDPQAFDHYAYFNEAASRIEMHLVARRTHRIHIAALELTIELAAGETIWTENSYKFTAESAAAMLSEGGLTLDQWHASDLFGLAVAAGS